MLNNNQEYPESFECPCCKANMSKCTLHLMPGDITIKEAEIVTISSQQIFKISEDDYDILFSEFRNSNLIDRVIKISCFACNEPFCELYNGHTARINGVLQTNAIQFRRKK